MSSAKIHSVLSVNGEQRDVFLSAHTTLLQALRDSLFLTGTKRGCNHGVCGACTILLDRAPARACLTLACDVGDRQVVTIEGLSDGPEFSAVQRALVDAGAVQCGFCTPGFVVALTDLFERRAHPDRAEIRAALSGNLCRCSGYVKIVAAAECLADRPDV
jgi:aerobic-type carbon monoxide dehydrogenase small subunit (CoxS/CutS family)